MERYLVSEKCHHCGLPVYADQGYHSVSGAHYQCDSEDKQKTITAFARVDEIFGVKEKKTRVRRGEGKSVQKVKVLIEEALKEKFESDDVTDITIYLTSPTWCRDIYDVHRFEGSARVEGHQVSFGSWATVTKLLQYSKLKLNDDWPCMDLFPVYETKKSKKD